MHILLAKNGPWATHLHEEVRQQVSPEAKLHKAFGVVQLEDSVDLKNQQIAFALATLPYCQEIAQDSIGVQAQQVVARIEEGLGVTDNKIKLQVFSLTQKYGILTTGRAQIFFDKLRKLLKKSSSQVRTGTPESQASLVQVMIWPDRSIALSILNPKEVEQHRSLLGPFAGGFTQIKDDLKAPSRAFKKLVESQKILGTSIGPEDQVLDLGASPGGWTYIAAQNGAHVTAVDRSPLEAELMQNPKVEFVKGDAFNFDDQKEYSWVISDIISEPKRVLELIEKWPLAKTGIHFVFTIKFKGDDNYHILKEIKESLKRFKGTHYFRQLNSNKNEVMVMGLASLDSKEA